MNVYSVTFQIHLPNSGAGVVDIYRRTPRTALVIAPTANESDVRPVLNNHVTLQAGEVFDILSATQQVFGTEGPAVFGSSGILLKVLFSARLPYPAAAHPNPPVAYSGVSYDPSWSRLTSYGELFVDNQYRKDVRSCLLLAASPHPADILGALNGSFTLLPGELFDLHGAQQLSLGTEGQGVWQ